MHSKNETSKGRGDRAKAVKAHPDEFSERMWLVWILLRQWADERCRNRASSSG